MATKRGRWLLVPIACAIAVIVCLVGPRYGPALWEWAAYGDWRPLEMPPTASTSGGRSGGVRATFTEDGRLVWVADPPQRSVNYVKLKEKRFSWLPGQEVQTVRITKEEYESLSESAGQ